VAKILLIYCKVHSEIRCRLLAALSASKKYGRLGDEVIVTNCGLTEECTADSGMWIDLVLGEGRPLYSGQPLDTGMKLCALY
jgi:hypothetical protein